MDHLDSQLVHNCTFMVALLTIYRMVSNVHQKRFSVNTSALLSELNPSI